MKTWPGWLVVLAGTTVAGCTPASTATTSSSPDAAVVANARVVRDVDGDTIDVAFGSRHERVRLIGVDTPETKKPNTPVQCYGPEASDFTKHTLPPGTAVRIVRDAEARDDYGRLLGYVYRASDGEFVNLLLAALGYARPLTIAPNTAHAAEIVAASTRAEADDLGLWAACNR